MIPFLLVILTACAASEDRHPPTNDDDIVGGRSATISANPWQVALVKGDGELGCGATLVHESWVLTANHCIDSMNPVAAIDVLAGSAVLSRPNQTRKIETIVRFPGYTDPLLGKDIALIKVSRPFDLSGPNAKAIALATEADAAAGITAPTVKARVSGWGHTSEYGSTLSDTLRAVELSIVSSEAAQQAYPRNHLTEDQLAAGVDEGGKDSCQGDSGGPLTVKAGRERKLAGVVSWGAGCGQRGLPGLYARVSTYARWIEETIATQR